MAVYLGIDPVSTRTCKLLFITVNDSKHSIFIIIIFKSLHFFASSHLFSGFFISIRDVAIPWTVYKCEYSVFSYDKIVSEKALADVHIFRPNGFQLAPAQASLLWNGWHPAGLEVVQPYIFPQLIQ